MYNFKMRRRLREWSGTSEVIPRPIHQSDVLDEPVDSGGKSGASAIGAVEIHRDSAQIGSKEDGKAAARLTGIEIVTYTSATAENEIRFSLREG